MKAINPDIFRADDIRGKVDRDFDAAWGEVLGCALGTCFRSKGFTASAS